MAGIPGWRKLPHRSQNEALIRAVGELSVQRGGHEFCNDVPSENLTLMGPI